MYKNTKAIIKLLILIAIVICVPLYVLIAHPEIIDNFKSFAAIDEFLEQYHAVSVFVYIGLQALQVLISAIPGQALQLAAGYAYNLLLAYIISIIGIAIGSLLAFLLARNLGSDALRLFLGDKKLDKFVALLNSKAGMIAVLLIFLIPGIPKDIFTYAVGLSQMKIRIFLPLTLAARTPGLLLGISVGAAFRSGSYVEMIVLIAVAAVLCVLGLVYRNKIMNKK